jgi:PAS domain S-box-containing protein
MDGLKAVSSLKISEAPKQSDLIRPESQIGTPPDRETSRTTLVWLALLVAAGLATFEHIKILLFPYLTPWQYEALTICAGTMAAASVGYYITRKLGRAVSMHVQAEKKLALERNVLRTVTDNIPDSIFAKDTEGRYLLTNKAFATLHGAKSPDDLLGKTAFDLFPKERAIVLHEDDLHVMRTRGASMESERTAVDAKGDVQ